MGIDWTRLTVPGNACFSPTAIHLKSAPFLDVDSNGEETWVPLGQAFIPSPMGNPKDHNGDGPRYVELTNAPTEIKYGEFGTHGEAPVAAVPLTCTNNGGTAAGQLLFSVAVYTRVNGQLKLLRLIAPQQALRQGSHVTLIRVGRISSDGVTVNETWYGPNDADCCATGEAISLWRYEAGTLRHVETRVTRRPK
ncbi:MAG: hypothetical protein JWM40_910 [Frankiales bacterium]|nr:hypothetical protein [Frankiales bacterium]